MARDRYGDRFDPSTYEDHDNTVGSFESSPKSQTHRLNDPLAAQTVQSISDYIANRAEVATWDGSVTFESD